MKTKSLRKLVSLDLAALEHASGGSDARAACDYAVANSKVGGVSAWDAGAIIGPAAIFVGAENVAYGAYTSLTDPNCIAARAEESAASKDSDYEVNSYAPMD